MTIGPTLNLVKAQEYAASLPLAELKKYADGFDPSMLPPWLATSEMQAKMKRVELANNLQGGASGQQPSVKEQIEQKAGLMALQQAQQAQAQQAQNPSPATGPVPEGAPQPRPQPQRPTMGGLDQLPSNIKMAGGGIVAFSGEDGSEVKYETPFDRMNRKNREAAAIESTKTDLQKLLDARARYEAAGADTSAIDQAIAHLRGNMGRGVTPPPAAVDLGPVPGSSDTDIRGGNPRGLRAPAQSDLGPVPGSSDTDILGGGLRNAAVVRPPVANPNVKPNLNAPRAVAPAPVANTPAAPAPDSMEAMFRGALDKGPTERTVDQAVGEQQALLRAAGVTDDAGAEKMKRIQALNDQYAATKPTGLQELIQMLGQSAQYKGFSGMAPAYTSMEAQKRAADLAHAAKINELMGAVEDTQRAEKKDIAKNAGADIGKSRENKAKFESERMQALGQARGQDIQANSAKYTADMHYKAAMAQIGEATRRADRDEKRQLIDSFKLRIGTLAKEVQDYAKKTVLTPQDKLDKANAEAELQGLNRALDEASGISKMTGARDATKNTGPKPPLSSFQR